MKRLTIILILVGALLLVVRGELAARGPGGGGGARGGGGGAARPSGGGAARPAAIPAARPAASPAARPAGGAAARSPAISTPVAGAANRPNVGNPTVRPNPGTGAATRPNAGPPTRPTNSQINNFVDAGVPSTGAIGAGNAGRGGAAADFLGGQGARPAQLPAGAAGRTGVGAGVGAGVAAGVGAGVAAGAARGNLASSRPSRIENRQQLQDNRQQRRDEVRNQVRENNPRLAFWADNPNWTRWRINAPYRWATWAALTGWFGWGSGYSETAYAYGDNVYYYEDQVYYGEQPVASAEDYAAQAAAIVAEAPQELDPQASDWMPLGVFAVTQDREASGVAPTMFMQLAVNKQGVISGTFNNEATGETQTLEGMIDKKSQRAAWCVQGKSWPIVETGLSNITQDTAPVLVHFEDGQTQQWLLVRLEEPKT